jgi:cytochrome oxidase Cu insertion factor (SCO1/SenC/PrrC family)
MSDILNPKLIAFGVCLTALVPTIGAAPRPQSAASTSTVDVETVGPKVGEVLPDFSLRDQRGQAQSLTSLLGPNGAVIVFFRSADW